MTAPETQGAPSIEHLCLLGSVSRAGFYRFGEVREPKRTEADLRDKIQKIALENRFYGYRRVAEHMEQGFAVRRGSVHLLGQRPERDATLLEAVHHAQQMRQRPA